MIRLTEFWFEFKGVRSTTMNVELLDMPVRPYAASRGDVQPIGGRHGVLWQPDDLEREVYDNIVVRLPCQTRGTFDIDEIGAWLSGAGDLRFSDEPDHVYRARIAKEFARSNRLPRFQDQIFTPSFDCFPLRYKRLASAAADDWVSTSSGQNCSNPGTVESEPRIVVEGSGNFIVNVGAQMLTFEGVTGGIVIDSELDDCLNLAMSELQNHRATFEAFPLLLPGTNIITWSGSVSKVTIRPRVRYR